MGFCSLPEYLEFMRQTPEFERMLVRSQIHWSNFGSRCRAASSAPVRRAPDRPGPAVEVLADGPSSSNRWEDYTEAKEAMFIHTDTADAPWTVVKSNDKKRPDSR